MQSLTGGVGCGTRIRGLAFQAYDLNELPQSRDPRRRLTPTRACGDLLRNSPIRRAVTGLTRRAVGPDGRGVVFTAVDLETTGLEDCDRIVELAAVVFRGDGEILDEYSTVVGPHRSVDGEWADQCRDACRTFGDG